MAISYSIFSYCRSNDLLLVLPALAASLVTAACNPVLTILLGMIFDELSRFSRGDTSGDTFSRSVLNYSVAIISMGLGTVLTGWAMITLWTLFADRQIKRARARLLKDLLHKRLEWFDTNADIVGKINVAGRNLQELHQSLSFSLAMTVDDLSVAIGCAIVAFYYSWSLTLVSLAGIPLVIVIGSALGVPINRAIMFNKTQVEETSASIEWPMKAMATVKLFNAEHQHHNWVQGALHRVSRSAVRMYALINLQEGVARTIMLCMFVQAFAYGGHLVRSGKASTGTVMTVFWCCIDVAGSFNSATQQLLFLQKGIAAAGQLNDLHSSHNLRDSIGLYPMIEMKSGIGESRVVLQEIDEVNDGDEDITIQFRNVTFRYPSRQNDPVLQNFSLSIARGEMLFLMGPSGCGKSSLVHLIRRHYNINRGSLRLEGFPVDILSASWIEENVFIAEQMPFLLPGATLRENLCLGREFEDEQLKLACKEFFVDFVDSLDSKINPSSMSGGQRQRIALARGRMHDTPIMIFDECTSALHQSLRTLVMATIKRYRKGPGKTTIFITHDTIGLDPIDRVALMENGYITRECMFKDVTSHQEKSIRHGNSHRNSLTAPLHEQRSTQRYSMLLAGDWAANINNLFGNPAGGAIKEDETKESPQTGDSHSQSSTLKILYQIFRSVPNKLLLLLGLATVTGVAVINPLFAWAFSNLMTGIVPNQAASSDPSIAMHWSIVVAALAIADGFLTCLKTLLDICSEQWLFSLRDNCMHVLMYQPMAWFQSSREHTAHNLVSLLLNDTESVRLILVKFLPGIVSAVVLALCTIIWSLATGWQLTLVGVSLIPGFYLCSAWYKHISDKWETRYSTQSKKCNAVVSQLVAEIRSVKLLGIEMQYSERLAACEAELEEVAFRKAFMCGLGYGVSHVFTYIAQGLLLWYGFKLVSQGAYSVSQMFQVFTLLVFCLVTLGAIVSTIPQVNDGFDVYAKLQSIVQQSEDNEGSEFRSPISYPMELEAKIPEMVFHKVSFWYPPESPAVPPVPIIQNLSFKLSPGEILGLVGQSGSGKSTITKLVCRLFEVSAGSIKLDGRDIRTFDIGNLRREIAVASQMPLDFFPGSICQNMNIGHSNAQYTHSLEEIRTMASLVGIDQSIMALDNQYDTQMESLHSHMSGGQLQRLGIVRALLQQPKILILDECTSALDKDSTRQILDCISQLRGSMSILMITHNLEFTKICDRIISLDS